MNLDYGLPILSPTSAMLKSEYVLTGKAAGLYSYLDFYLVGTFHFFFGIVV